LAAGASISRIPLELDHDADFYLRGIQTGGTIQGLQFRLEDPKGHPLCDTENSLQEMNYQFPGLYSEMDGAGIVTLDNADDYGLYCQAGSRMYLYVLNGGATIINLAQFILTLHGVKRYSGDRCAA
jgi:hypothetical protein